MRPHKPQSTLLFTIDLTRAMEITVTVSPSAAARLNERAAATGKDVTDYAAPH